MGYSARYHAASLAAVFLALAVGILVGAEFGGEVLSDTRQSLERSLVNNLEESREEIDQLTTELDRSEEFAQRVYPALTGDRLLGDRVGILALGGLSSSTVSNIDTALEPTGADIEAIGVVREPPRPEALADSLVDTRFEGIAEDPALLEDLGAVVGRQLIEGGNLLERIRGDVFSRVSGSFGDLDQLIVLRSQPAEMEPDESEATSRLEDGLIAGLGQSNATFIGAEATDSDPSSIGFFDSRNVTSVDNVDMVSGQLSLILALLGAQGNFGMKETADSLLPDLITGTGLIPVETNIQDPGPAEREQ